MALFRFSIIHFGDIKRTKKDWKFDIFKYQIYEIHLDLLWTTNQINANNSITIDTNILLKQNASTIHNKYTANLFRIYYTVDKFS